MDINIPIPKPLGQGTPSNYAGAALVDQADAGTDLEQGAIVIVKVTDQGAPVFWDLDATMQQRALDLANGLLDYAGPNGESPFADFDLIVLEYDYNLFGKIEVWTTWRKRTNSLAVQAELAKEWGAFFAVPLLIPLAILAAAVATAALAGAFILNPDAVRVVIATTAVAAGSDDPTLVALASKDIDEGNTGKALNVAALGIVAFIAWTFLQTTRPRIGA